MTDRQSVLLTGATGALGPALAAELLADDASRHLDVLIRRGESENRTVANRFSDWIDSVAAVLADREVHPAANWRERVQPVEGDIRSDHLGLSTSTRDELARRTNLVIHAAADTQFLNSPETQWDTNVEGTRRVIELTRSCQTRPRLLLVSTICTSGTRTGRIEEAFSEQPPTFVNHYERTKWEAERLCMAVTDLPIAMARISIVMGSHASGAVHRPGALHHIVKWFSRGLIPIIPGTEQSRVDLIATETAARFIAKAAAVSDWREPHAVWHVAAGEGAAPLHEMTEVAWSEAFPGQLIENRDQAGEPFIVDQEDFARICSEKTAPRDRLFRQAMDSINSFIPGLLYPRTYDTTQAQALWGGALPCPDWRTTFRAVMKSCGYSAQPGGAKLNKRLVSTAAAAACEPVAK